MINKLKRRFTVLATVSMLILMVVLIIIMNLVNLTSVIGESDIILDVLAQLNAPFTAFNDFDPDKPDKPADGMEGAVKDGWGSIDIDDMDKDDIGNFIPRGMSPEVPYESRYFTVMVDLNGEIQESDLSNIISVDSSSMNEYLTKAVSSRSNRGFAGQFRYLKQSDEVVTRIIFLDCGRKLDTFYNFLWVSIGVGLFGCLIVFIAFLLVSGKIVRPIAESYEKQKRFISDAGHEIKTPLTIINANVDLLEDDDEENEELQEIRNQTKRLTELTNNLVYLSKMEESDNRVQKVDLPLSDLVVETANSFQNVAAANGIGFTKNIRENLSINGAPDSIRQLVSILLENAVKYSPEGGEIRISLSSGKKSAILTVSNTAKEKVNVEDLPRVFDRFYRTDASRNSATGGHGIGLSIAKAIVEQHGGSIKASTTDGSDFCVTAELPL